MSGAGSKERPRTKTPDLTELFRHAHTSRHSSKNAGPAESNASTSVSSQSDKPVTSKSRRSMLPFLGRKKSAEQPVAAPPRKSLAGPAPPNTVRRSLGNGHTVIMITPSGAPSSIAPPLPTTLPALNVSPSSLGSKLAAHFTPLRSPSKASKSGNSTTKKANEHSSSTGTLAPPGPDVSLTDSPRSSTQSRSTTPRPSRTPQSSVIHGNDGEDYSDLFFRPHQLEEPLQAAKCASSPTVLTGMESGQRSGVPSSSVRLQFPIPPPLVGRPSLAASDRTVARRSGDLLQKDSSNLSSKASSIASKTVAYTRAQSDTGSERTIPRDHLSSGDEHRQSRNRAASHSGSDTDASRAYDSSPRVGRIRQSPTIPRSSSIKQPSSYQGTKAKVSSNLPPACPLPSPPLSSSGCASTPSNTIPTMPFVANTGARSRPSTVPQRPRATTLSSSTLSSTHTPSQPGSSASSTYQKAFATENKVVSGISPNASPEELREALILQRKKYAQLQEYIITITKRYEDDRVGLTKTIEKLERDIRKKTKEIEGLRWLVIHHGAVEDIDAAANLARSSLSTQDDCDRPDTDRGSSPVTPKRLRPPLAKEASNDSFSGTSTEHVGKIGSVHHFGHTRQSSSALEVPSEDQSTAFSLFPTTHPTSINPLSAIPERSPIKYDISRSERQQAKEDRRAARALRRISGSSGSSLSSGANLLLQSPTGDPFVNPKANVDVTEKLGPLRNS